MEDKLNKAAKILADKASQNDKTVSDLFYRLLEKSEELSPVKSEIVLRACEILEKKDKSP